MTKQKNGKIEYYSILGKSDGIEIVIFADGKSNKINTFRMFVNKEIDQSVIEDMDIYFLTASQILNPELALDVLDENLILTDFENGLLEVYETKEAKYSKSIFDEGSTSSAILDIVAK